MRTLVAERATRNVRICRTHNGGRKLARDGAPSQGTGARPVPQSFQRREALKASSALAPGHSSLSPKLLSGALTVPRWAWRSSG